LAFPVGFDAGGLPVGMQLMGPDFREEILFRLAHAYQQVTGWHQMAPVF
jgi:aspartyl-tRNA(Asn)/glutamyl-tRNA(Gln) amidotransferase subunit A